MKNEENKEKEKYNFCEENIFYIQGLFDNTFLIDIIPKLQKRISELKLEIEEIKDNEKIKDEEKEKQLKEKKIIFHINSFGGDIYILFQILNFFNYAKSVGIIIETYCHFCGSCASILAVSGTKGHRYGGEFSTHYIHNARGFSYFSNNIENKRSFENVERLLNKIKYIYQKNTKLSKEIIDKEINNENWEIFGEDLEKFGLIDKLIIEENDK